MSALEGRPWSDVLSSSIAKKPPSKHSSPTINIRLIQGAGGLSACFKKSYFSFKDVTDEKEVHNPADNRSLTDILIFKVLACGRGSFLFRETVGQ